jgi:hypothetical protein
MEGLRISTKDLDRIICVPADITEHLQDTKT